MIDTFLILSSLRIRKQKRKFYLLQMNSLMKLLARLIGAIFIILFVVLVAGIDFGESINYSSSFYVFLWSAHYKPSLFDDVDPFAYLTILSCMLFLLESHILGRCTAQLRKPSAKKFCGNLLYLLVDVDQKYRIFDKDFVEARSLRSRTVS